ncbi:transglycosylase SLT domain-containing protein [Leptolyngbya sp. FACHB-261]|uniref:transglycosylase SLT domain-containing protein n=1 Tax=Leptolyngbya sp. FACHB-261 TaxID=2692806 RepID=UPI001687DD9D|nr:transglycosylase SLT domain-containing protein [Leptolyngbya sp. FACHB-261]MBD2103308.1 transglycosylase SLT domain-containing protein [Leptolyngbya sp. FACHB-261]
MLNRSIKNWLRCSSLGTLSLGWTLSATPSLACSQNLEPEQEIAAITAAISEQESGDDYQAVNPESGALGRWQVLPENVISWSQEVLGEVVSTDEFLENPDIQDQIAAYKLSQYYYEALGQTGDSWEAKRFVAAKWYSGEGSLWGDTEPQVFNGQLYPSIAEYSLEVASKAEQIEQCESL